MDNQYICGKASISLREPVAIINRASIAGIKESMGPYGEYFDITSKDKNDLFGQNDWEDAESSMQKEVLDYLICKCRMDKSQIRYIFCGDLLGQTIATSFGVGTFQIPLFGLFGACSTAGESLALGAILVSAGYGDYVVCMTSSHFASAEKEFRAPLAYGGQRPLSASWTVTGSGAFLLGKKSQNHHIVITKVTPGKIVDYGIKDTFNMGCAMAPAAADTIKTHFEDNKIDASYYDAIITGDLGVVGSKALLDLLLKDGYDITKQHIDCGANIFGKDENNLGGMDSHAGGSGCGCAAIMLAAVYLSKIEKGLWQKILFVPTGALLNKTSFNEGNTVPGIAHALVIEYRL